MRVESERSLIIVRPYFESAVGGKGLCLMDDERKVPHRDLKLLLDWLPRGDEFILLVVIDSERVLSQR